MSIYNECIKPYNGIGNISFNMTYDETREYLKAHGIKYTVDFWENKGCDPEVPWKIIRVDNCISFFFAKGKMFKICLESNYAGLLENGIRIGMSINEAQGIDPSIIFEDDEEYYSSDLGYWLEDDIETKAIISITIFIKEILDDDLFFSYQWTQ